MAAAREGDRLQGRVKCMRTEAREGKRRDAMRDGDRQEGKNSKGGQKKQGRASHSMIVGKIIMAPMGDETPARSSNVCARVTLFPLSRSSIETRCMHVKRIT